MASHLGHNLMERAFTERRRMRQSFRERKQQLQQYSQHRKQQLHELQQTFQKGAMNRISRISRIRRVPRWVRWIKRAYHNYGGKHVMLILILVLYNFLGAAIFYFCEVSANENKEEAWRENIQTNRMKFIERSILPSMFNNSKYLFFINSAQTDSMTKILNDRLHSYEDALGVKYTDQKIRWDFWTAMLYAQTICTTIGYGHLYPSTTPGRVATMIYAIIGIPLVFSILADLGKLLTKCLKYPWFLLKCLCRRLFRYCTKQSMEEIRRLDDEDRQGLAVFDLPIPVAILLVVIWIFVCSATFTIWEHEWDYFLAFYFFFISLSTIGLGDITPSQPKYLLMLFGYIIIGLSLVSMVINLIQSKIERTYEAGKDDLSERLTMTMDGAAGDGLVNMMGETGKVTLGILQRSSSYSLSSKQDKAPAQQQYKKNHVVPVHSGHKSIILIHRSTQTLLSFPSPRHKGEPPSLTLHRGKMLSTSLSIDDVMRIVDTDEGDMVILTELSRDVSMERDIANQEPCCEQPVPHLSDSVAEDHSLVEGDDRFDTVSDEFEYTPAHYADYTQLIRRERDLYDIEELEELEDRILLGHPHPVMVGPDQKAASGSSVNGAPTANTNEAGPSSATRAELYNHADNGGASTSGGILKHHRSASPHHVRLLVPDRPLLSPDLDPDPEIDHENRSKIDKKQQQQEEINRSQPIEYDYREIDEHSGLIDPEEQGETDEVTEECGRSAADAQQQPAVTHSLDQVFGFLRSQANALTSVTSRKGSSEL